MSKYITKEEMIICIGGVICSFGIVAVTIFIAEYKQIDFSMLSRDAVSVLGGNGFTGLFSKLGIILWGIAAVSLLMGWYHGKTHMPKAKETRLTLLFGCVTAVMYLDDYLLLHEFFIPYYLHLPEITLIGIYMISTVALVIVYYKELKGNGLILIILSFGFLGFSAIIDKIFFRQHIQLEYIFEDGSKLIGIVLWTLFALYRATKIIGYRSENVES